MAAITAALTGANCVMTQSASATSGMSSCGVLADLLAHHLAAQRRQDLRLDVQRIKRVIGNSNFHGFDPFAIMSFVKLTQRRIVAVTSSYRPARISVMSPIDVELTQPANAFWA